MDWVYKALFTIFAGRTTPTEIMVAVRTPESVMWNGKTGLSFFATTLYIAAMIPARSPPPHELLAFYLEAGVDCALAEEPSDRLEIEAEPAPAPRRIAPLPSVAAPAAAPPADLAPAPDAAIESARGLAPRAKPLHALRGQH